ncbi:putative CCCH-type zinc finger family protein [Tanacetum coccineum]
MFQRFQNLRKGIKTVEEYTKEFYELVSPNDLSDIEEQLVSRYLGGLCQSIQDVRCLYTFWTVFEVYQRALAIEKQQTRSGNRSGGSQKKFAGVKQAEHGAKSQEYDVGYRSSDCRKEKGKQLMIENEKHESDDYKDEEEYTVEPSYDEYEENKEDNFVYGDIGQMLVIRKSLLLPKEDESGDWLRNNIFHTTCTIKNKVCKLIVDSGSCENVISRDAVEKLNLKQEKHLKPYKLSWFKKKNEMNVDTRCLVSLPIGRKYFDNVWCDVVLIDTCHVLLGRPWQFDHCTTHDGRSNTYSFNKDNVNMTLVPSKAVGFVKSTKKGNENLLSITNFIDEVDESRIMYALVVRDEEPLVSVPHFVKSLIEKYADVMPKELPSGLPPVRDIQHHIDLIPGSSLPNKAAYRMSPKEHEELQRQVEEAMVKGLIRISMSPCVVPALLTPKKYGTWRMCVDSRAINKITVKYRYLIGSTCWFKEGGVMVDRSKVHAIVEWPTPRSIHDVRSFHGLASFYRHFIRKFSSLKELITECMKGGLKFYYTPEASEIFELVKKKMSEAPILVLPNFGKVFEVECDASKVGIGAVLSQE